MTMSCRPCLASRDAAACRVEIGRRAGLARALVEEQGGEGGEPGEAPARRTVQHVCHSLHGARVEASLVAGIEGIAGRLDAGDQRLLVALGARRLRGLGSFLFVEDGPVVRAHGRGLRRLVTRDLTEMAEMGQAVTVGMDRPGAGHVDGNETVDPARLERIERRRVAADLLGHRQHVEAEPARLGAHQLRILGHRIEVEQVGAGGHAAGLVKLNRGFEERPVPGLQRLQKHRPLPPP